MIVADTHKAAVERMLAYIDDHLTEPVTLQKLAGVACYSPWHSARMFKELTGMAPFSYLRHRRLSEAARRLQQNDVRIVDVAFDFVFDSHEGFTRAFSRQFGMNPQSFRRDFARISSIRLSDKTKDMVRHHGGGRVIKTVFVQVVERPARKAVVRFAQKASHYFEYCEEVGCDTWDVLSSVKEALNEPIGMWMPLAMRRLGSGEYLQGVEVPCDWKGEVPNGFDVIELPPCSLMIFQGPPFDETRFEQAITDLWDVMKRYDPTLYGYEWADDTGPRFQLAPMGYRGYIEGRPVRRIS